MALTTSVLPSKTDARAAVMCKPAAPTATPPAPLNSIPMVKNIKLKKLRRIIIIIITSRIYILTSKRRWNIRYMIKYITLKAIKEILHFCRNIEFQASIPSPPPFILRLPVRQP
ncbi:MAG: hypothetical protein ACP5I8_17640, partial [Phycisphaerae bacterium]